MELQHFINVWGQGLKSKFDELGETLKRQGQAMPKVEQSPLTKSVLTALAPGVQSFIEGGFKGYGEKIAGNIKEYAQNIREHPETVAQQAVLSTMNFEPLMGAGKKIAQVAKASIKMEKGLQGLAQEARKYKSAEEFVNSQTGVTKPIENKMLGRFWIDEKTGKVNITSMGRDNNLRSWKQTPERSFNITPQIAEDFNKSFGKVYGEITPGQKAYSYKGDLLIEPGGIKQSGAFADIERTAQEIRQNWINSHKLNNQTEVIKKADELYKQAKTELTDLTKSQLTDIWNEANKKLK